MTFIMTAVPGNVIGEQVAAVPILRILHNYAEALEALEPGMFKSNENENIVFSQSCSTVR